MLRYSTKHSLAALLSAALALGVLSSPAPAQPDDLTWKVIATGGGTLTDTMPAGFRLSGTVGQHTLGVMTGGGFEMIGGFWSEDASAFCNADFNMDGDGNPDDLADYIGDYFSLPGCPAN